MCIGPPLVLSMHLCFPFICRSVGLFMALASVLALMEKGKFVGSGAFCRVVFYTCHPSFKRVTTTLAGGLREEYMHITIRNRDLNKFMVHAVVLFKSTTYPWTLIYFCLFLNLVLILCCFICIICLKCHQK